jgi:exodeoxyribonuclease V alpha subunit
MTDVLHSPSPLLGLLDQWVARGWLRELDVALVRFLHEESPDASAAVLLSAALVSHQLGRGHVCLDLRRTLEQPGDTLAIPPERYNPPDLPTLQQPDDVIRGWTLPSWCAELQRSDLVDEGSGQSPLVLNGHRLYLRRYWCHERDIEHAIERRLALSESMATAWLIERLRESLSRLFPSSTQSVIDWQQMACAVAARSAFSVITGGPGTGKTTTVVRLLALLQHLALAHALHPPLVIRLAAPTGKAAARLKQSIRHALHLLPTLDDHDAAVRKHIPSDVTTLHRLLGTRPDSRLFRHDARHPLALDVLVVDEASMVDLDMMAATLQALPPRARLILLGDKDQLASVEAGSVLGELCRRATAGHYRPELAQWLRDVTNQSIPEALQDPHGRLLDQHIVMLRHSHRFDQVSGIGQLATAVNAGDVHAIEQVLSQDHADVIEHRLSSVEDEQFESVVLGPVHHTAGPQGLAHYLKIMHTDRPEPSADITHWNHWAQRVLTAHGRFQLLCALRNGPCGVSGLNRRIESILQRHQLIDATGAWYAGRPVIVTRNDYALGLMNGDMGITLPFPTRHRDTGELEWTLRVAFPTHDDATPIHWVLPSRLNSVDTVYALTVHKSQGSEFEHCALLLPPERSSVITRELIYTGITRGKSWFSLVSVGHHRLLQEASLHTVQRSGGLFDHVNPD